MQAQNLQADSVNDFLNSIQSGTPLPETIPQDNITNIQPSSLQDEVVLGETEEGSAQEFLNGIKSKEVVPEKVDDKFQSYIDYLKEQQILIEYEDGTLPQTKEEVADAIKQSSLYIAQQQAQQYIDQEIGSLPPAIQQIIDFGKGGVTTATELQHFISSVSNYEKVNQLDPSDENHQEIIVKMQLRNSGLDDVSVEEQIEMLRETNKLSQFAEKLIVPLKETYRKEYQNQMIEKQEKENFLASQIDANSVNIQYYLDQDTSYLPFKLDDNRIKAGVYDLGAKVAEWDDKGNPIFQWQKKMESLQYSTNPEDYKQFVKLLVVLNDSNFYDKKLSKVVSNTTTEKEYKQIKQVKSNSVIATPQGDRQVAQSAQRGPLTWN